MQKHFVAFAAIVALSGAVPANAADVGSPAEVMAIRKVFPAKFGRCTQRVDRIAVRGSYALATVLETGACDAAGVWVLQKRGTWRTLGGIGGVPDACTVHSKGVPLSVAGPLVAAFNGTSNPSLTSTRTCGGK